MIGVVTKFLRDCLRAVKIIMKNPKTPEKQKKKRVCPGAPIKNRRIAFIEPNVIRHQVYIQIGPYLVPLSILLELMPNE